MICHSGICAFLFNPPPPPPPSPFLFFIHFLPSVQRAFISISALDLLHFPNFPNFSQLLFQHVIKASGTLHYAVVHLGPVSLQTLVIHAIVFLVRGRGLMKKDSQILNAYHKLWNVIHFALPSLTLCAYFLQYIMYKIRSTGLAVMERSASDSSLFQLLLFAGLVLSENGFSSRLT